MAVGDRGDWRRGFRRRRNDPGGDHDLKTLVHSFACVHVDVARSVRPRRNTSWITDVDTASESLHLFVAGSVVVLVPLVGRVVGGDEDRREASGDETSLDLEPERIRVEDLQDLLQLHLALELFEHDRRLIRVAVPPEAAVPHVDDVDVWEEVVDGIGLADARRSNDGDDFEIVAPRRRSECGELEATGGVPEEDSGVDGADVACPHELLCGFFEVSPIALLRRFADCPRSFETSFSLRAVRFVLIGVALSHDEVGAVKDVEDFSFGCLACDLLEPRHALRTRELNVALEMRRSLLPALELVDDVLEAVWESVREEHFVRWVVCGEAPRARFGAVSHFLSR